MRVSRVCARGGALLSGSPQPGRGRACWQAWCRNRADVRHLSWGTMGAHRRTNPERLPGGGSVRLKWKQRAGAVQVATKAKEVTEDPPPPCVSPHPTPTHCSPRMEKGKPCTGSWGLAPALCLFLQWQQWLWSPLARSTASLSLLQPPPGGWAGGYHTQPTGAPGR